MEQSISSLPPRARHFVLATVGVGLAVVGGVVATGLGAPLPFWPGPATRDLLLPTLLVGITLLTSVFKITLPLTRPGPSLSVSFVVNLVSLLLAGTGFTMLLASLGGWCQTTFRVPRYAPLHRRLFSMAALALSALAAGLTFELLGGVPGTTVGLIDTLGPVLGASVSYFLVNTALVATATALASGRPVWNVWQSDFSWSAPGYLLGAAAAVLIVELVMRTGRPALVLTVLGPIYVIYAAVASYVRRIDEERRRTEDVSRLHLEALEALASAIDAKDQLAPGHIRRVQHYATVLARDIGMSGAEVRGVQTAAMLHDVGKLAIPEHILSKPGPLTPSESLKVRTHPKIGADILASVPFPYPVTPLILAHHERWDGQGYPAGLAGEDIPLGARILALVDFFDVVMTARPYREAATYEEAVERVRGESGAAFDPALVERFLEVLPSMAPDQGERERMALERPLIVVDPEPATPAPPSPDAQVFEDIALANREFYALYEMAHAMGSSLGVTDTMTLIASKLQSLVPYTSCALFLHDENSDTLACRFATGVDASTIRQLVVRRGDGLTGSVAIGHRTALNGRPGADLEATGRVDTTLEVRSALVCPLRLDETLIGTLAVYHTEESFYGEDHRRLMDRVSEQAAAVISNSLRFEQTQADSLTDPLTGLPNTRYLYLHLAQELARSRRERTPVGLLVLDLDDFKSINDTYGHHVGDRALREAAGVLQLAIRPYDVCARYAGDEFILVLSSCGREEAEAKRREIGEALEALEFEARPDMPVRLAASIGTAIFPEDGEDYEALLASADRRMYASKARRKGERRAVRSLREAVGL